MDITLALGGGGVKGFAHIGVLRCLEQNGIHVRAIAGSSAGGMVGSIYAAGYNPDEVLTRLKDLDQSKLYYRLPGDGPSLLGFNGVARILEEFLADLSFNELKMPFAVTAVNIDNGELEILNSGPVLKAILATAAVPGIFPPVEWEGRHLIDGAVLDPVPVSLARKLRPDLPVVAVVLYPPMEEWLDKNNPPRMLSSIPMINYIYQTRLIQSFNIFLRSVDIGGTMLSDLHLQVDAPDLIIRPALAGIGMLDTVSVSELARLGEVATQAALPKLQTLQKKRLENTQRPPWWNIFGRGPSASP